VRTELAALQQVFGLFLDFQHVWEGQTDTLTANHKVVGGHHNNNSTVTAN